MTKHQFYPMFYKAWLASFTSTNIKSAFAKAGIWPYQPSQVLDLISTRPKIPPEIPEIPNTPMSSKGIRRLHKSYKLEPTQEKLDLILYTNVKLAA